MAGAMGGKWGLVLLSFLIYAGSAEAYYFVKHSNTRLVRAQGTVTYLAKEEAGTQSGNSIWTGLGGGFSNGKLNIGPLGGDTSQKTAGATVTLIPYGTGMVEYISQGTVDISHTFMNSACGQSSSHSELQAGFSPTLSHLGLCWKYNGADSSTTIFDMAGYTQTDSGNGFNFGCPASGTNGQKVYALVIPCGTQTNSGKVSTIFEFDGTSSSPDLYQATMTWSSLAMTWTTSIASAPAF